MGWSAFRKTGLTFHNPNRSVKGYTLFAPLADSSVYLIDMAGQVVKQWTFSDFNPSLARLLPSGHLMVAGSDPKMVQKARAAEEKELAADLTLLFRRLGGSYTDLREYDFAGNLLWSYENPATHHDFYLLENDNLLLPVWSAIPEALAKQVQGGIRKRGGSQIPMLGDAIIEINREGQEISRLCTWELFNPRRDPIQPLQRRWEWTHMNSLERTPAGQLIISCRNNSRVAMIDANARQIVWQLGSPEISLQHHATPVPGGNIQIFDNGMNKPGSLPYSRVIEVDPKTSEVVWEYKGQPPQQFYSGHISGAQRLDVGNVLICEGASGRLFEVTRQGEVVWEWITPFVSGSPSGDLMTWIYRAYRYDLDHPALVGQDLDPGAYKKLNSAMGLFA